MTNSITLVESLAPTGTKSVGKRWRARIIEADRWGSSAYYPAEVLERDGARVFTSGLPMYLNHPTETEKYDRPERSVENMVGKLLTDAVFEEDGLYADVEFYDSFVTMINERAEDVGLSVRASGLTEDGEMDGRYGPILVGMLAAESVDVVTRAGAGGKLTSILESDREPAGTPIENKEGTPVTDITKEDFDSFKADFLTTLTEAFNGLTESLKPAVVETVEETDAEKAEKAAQVEESKVDMVAVATAVTEAELPATAISRVAAEVAKGTELEEAVKAEVAYVSSGSREAGTVNLEEAGKNNEPFDRVAYATAKLGNLTGAKK